MSLGERAPSPGRPTSPYNSAPPAAPSASAATNTSMLTPNAQPFTPSSSTRLRSFNAAAPAFQPMSASSTPASGPSSMSRSLSAGAWQPPAAPAYLMPHHHQSQTPHEGLTVSLNTPQSLPPQRRASASPGHHLLLQQPTTPGVYGPTSPGGSSSGFSLSPRPSFGTHSPLMLPSGSQASSSFPTGGGGGHGGGGWGDDSMSSMMMSRRPSHEGGSNRRQSRGLPIHTPLRSTGHNSKPSISFIQIEPPKIPKVVKRKAIHVSLPVEGAGSDDEGGDQENEQSIRLKAQEAARFTGEEDEDVITRKGEEAVKRHQLRKIWTRRTPIDATSFVLSGYSSPIANIEMDDLVSKQALPEHQVGSSVTGLPDSIEIYLPTQEAWEEQREVREMERETREFELEAKELEMQLQQEEEQLERSQQQDNSPSQGQGSPLREMSLQAHDRATAAAAAAAATASSSGSGDDPHHKHSDLHEKVRDYLASSPQLRASISSTSHQHQHSGHRHGQAMSLSIPPAGESFATGAMSALGLSPTGKARSEGGASDHEPAALSPVKSFVQLQRANSAPGHMPSSSGSSSVATSAGGTKLSWKELSAGFGYPLQDVSEELEEDLRTNPSEDADASDQEDEDEEADVSLAAPAAPLEGEDGYDETGQRWRRDSLDDLSAMSRSDEEDGEGSLGEFSNPSDEEEARREREEWRERRRALAGQRLDVVPPTQAEEDHNEQLNTAGRPRAGTNETFASSQLHPSPRHNRPGHQRHLRPVEGSDLLVHERGDDSENDGGEAEESGTFGQRSVDESATASTVDAVTQPRWSDDRDDEHEDDDVGRMMHFRLPSINNSSFGSSALAQNRETDGDDDTTLFVTARDRQSSAGSQLNATAAACVPGGGGGSSSSFTFQAPQGAPELPVIGSTASLSAQEEEWRAQQGREKRARKGMGTGGDEAPPPSSTLAMSSSEVLTPTSPMRPTMSAATIEGGLRTDSVGGPPPFNPKGLPPFFGPSGEGIQLAPAPPTAPHAIATSAPDFSSTAATTITGSTSIESDLSAAAPSFLPTWAKRGGGSHSRPGIPNFSFAAEDAEAETEDSSAGKTPTPSIVGAQVPSTSFTFHAAPPASKAIPIRRPPEAVDAHAGGSGHLSTGPGPSSWTPATAARSPSLGIPSALQQHHQQYHQQQHGQQRGLTRRPSSTRPSLRLSSSTASVNPGSPRQAPPELFGDDSATISDAGGDDESLSDFVEDVAARLSEVFDAWGDRILDEITRVGQARPSAGAPLLSPPLTLPSSAGTAGVKIEEGEKLALVRKIREVVEGAVAEQVGLIAGAGAGAERDDMEQAVKQLTEALDTKLAQIAATPSITIEQVEALLQQQQATKAASSAETPEGPNTAQQVLDALSPRITGLDKMLAELRDDLGERIQVALVNGVLPHLEPQGVDVEAIATRVAAAITEKASTTPIAPIDTGAISTVVLAAFEPLLQRNADTLLSRISEVTNTTTARDVVPSSPTSSALDITPVLALLEPLVAKQENVRFIATQLLEKHNDVAAGIGELPAALNAKLDVLLNARSGGEGGGSGWDDNDDGQGGAKEVLSKLNEVRDLLIQAKEKQDQAAASGSAATADKTELEDLREQLDSHKTQLEKARADLVASNSYTKALKIEIARLEQFCTRADEDKERQRLAAVADRERVVDAEKRVGESEAKRKTKEEQLAAVREQLEKLGREVEVVREERVKEREDEAKASASLQERLTAAEAAVERERTLAAEQARHSKDDYSKLQFDHQATLERLHRSEGESTSLTKRLRESDEQVQNLRSVSSLQKQSAAELQQRLSEVTKSLEVTQRSEGELRQSLSKLLYLEGREKERAKLEEKVRGLERERGELLEANRVYQEHANVLEGEMESFKGVVVGREALELVQRGLAASRAEVASLRQELEEARRGNSNNGARDADGSVDSPSRTQDSSFDVRSTADTSMSMWSPQSRSRAAFALGQQQQQQQQQSKSPGGEAREIRSTWAPTTKRQQVGESAASSSQAGPAATSQKNGSNSAWDGPPTPARSPDENAHAASAAAWDLPSTMATPTKRTYQQQQQSHRAPGNSSNASNTPSCRTPLQSYRALPNASNEDAENLVPPAVRRPLSRAGSVASISTNRSAVKGHDGWWS